MIVVLSGANQSQSKLAAITFPNKISYAQRYRYGYNMVTQGFDLSRPAQWSKILFIERQLRPGVDWVFWTDADSLITNPDISLDSIISANYDVILSKDWDGANTGNMLVRNTPESHYLLKEIWKQKRFIKVAPADQEALKYVTNSNPSCARVKLLSQRIMNSFDYTQYAGQFPDYPEGQWHPGDFIIHFPAKPIEEKARLLSNFL